MDIIDVRISEDRTVECENIYAGVVGENNVTKLKFTVPESYKDFFKYLDIIKSDGEKTETFIEDDKNNVFYYTLPFSLTDREEITLQLVMKDKEKVFKSNIFVLHFNGSIDGTQKLLGDYQDTIEYLMENKASKEEIKEINSKMALKTSKSEFYNFSIKAEEELSKKVSDDDFLTFKNDSLNKLNLKVNKTVYEEDKENLESDILSLKNNKVDKIDGRGLSEENYTKKEKQKLAELPVNEELQIVLTSKATKEEVEQAITNLVNSSPDALDTLKELANALGNDPDFATTVLNLIGAKVDKETYNEKMSNIDENMEEIETNIGNIDSALSELHNYAQGITSGGVI